MEGSVQDRLLKALDELTTDNVIRLKHTLSSKTYRNLQKMTQSQMEKANNTINLLQEIIQHYTEDEAISVVTEALRDIPRNDLAQKLEGSQKRPSDSLDGRSQKRARMSTEDNDNTQSADPLEGPSREAGRTYEKYYLSDIEEAVDANREKLVEKLRTRLEATRFEKLRTELLDKTLKLFRFKGADLHNEIKTIDKFVQRPGPIELNDFIMKKVLTLLFRKSSNQSKGQSKIDPLYPKMKSNVVDSQAPSVLTAASPPFPIAKTDEFAATTPSETSSAAMVPSTKSTTSATLSTAHADAPFPDGTTAAASCYKNSSTTPKTAFSSSNNASNPPCTASDAGVNGSQIHQLPSKEDGHSLIPGHPKQRKTQSKATKSQMETDAIKKYFFDQAEKLERENQKEHTEAMNRSKCSLDRITERAHKLYQCLIAENILIYKDPVDGSDVILDIKLPKQLNTHGSQNPDFSAVLTKKGNFTAKEKFLLQFNMGVVGSVSKTTVYLYGAEKPIKEVCFNEQKFAVFTKRFERCFSELLVPVIALFKDVQKEILCPQAAHEG